MQKTHRLTAAVALYFWKQSVSITLHTKPHDPHVLLSSKSQCLARARGNTLQAECEISGFHSYRNGTGAGIAQLV